MYAYRNSSVRVKDFSKEFVFSTSRSSGAGGQHVNKVETKVELRFNVPASKLLSDSEKNIILKKLKNRINANGDLIIISQAARSQLQNKQKTIEKFYSLIRKALKPPKKRVPTKPTQAAVQKRLEAKRKHSEKKTLRRKDFL